MTKKAKKSWLKSALDMTAEALLPRRSDPRDYAIKKSVLSIMLAVAVVFTAAFTANFLFEDSQRERIAELGDIVRKDSDLEKQNALKKFREINPDVTSIVNISGADVLLPVVECESDYYKNHNYDGSRSRYGALYTDKNQKSGKSRVIYGNNMADDTMFGKLSLFRNPKNYIADPIVEVIDSKGSHPYVVFAVVLLDPNDKEDDFDITKSEFDSYGEFSSWRNELEARSIIDSVIKVQPEEEIICFVTDSDEFRGAQLAVMAFSLTEDRDIDYLRDATANTDVKYPEKMYK